MLWFCSEGRYLELQIMIFARSVIFSYPAYYCQLIKLLKDLKNALGGLSEVIFNLKRRGCLGILVLVPGQTTPFSLAQFEQLSTMYACCLCS